MTNDNDKVYRILASCIDAFKRCRETGNTEWAEKHGDTIIQVINDHLPHGSGIDSGVKIDWEHSSGEKIVLDTAFHHMDENGYYDGWTNHSVTVRPSLIHGITLSISGRDKNGIKEYLYDTFSDDLTRTVVWIDGRYSRPLDARWIIDERWIIDGAVNAITADTYRKLDSQEHDTNRLGQRLLVHVQDYLKTR